MVKKKSCVHLTGYKYLIYSNKTLSTNNCSKDHSFLANKRIVNEIM